MSKQRQAIDEALRRHRWRSLLADIKHSWWAVASLIALLVGATYWFATPENVASTTFGVANGGRVTASYTGRERINVTVRLETGELVSTTLPRGALYRTEVLMELRVLERAWWPRTLRYQFVRYTDAPSSALQTETAE